MKQKTIPLDSVTLAFELARNIQELLDKGYVLTRARGDSGRFMNAYLTLYFEGGEN
jgi:hypothetical protein